MCTARRLREIFRKDRLSNNRGFSYIESLVAVGLLTMVTGTIVTTASQTLAEQTRLKQRNSGKEFIESISSFLLSKEGCSRVFGGQGFNTNRQVRTNLSLPRQYIKASSYSYNGRSYAGPIQVNTPITDDLMLTQFNISNSPLAPVSVNVNNRVLNQYTARVNISIGGRANSVEQGRQLNIPVIVDQANRITACGNNITQEDVCNSLHQTWDPVSGVCKGAIRCEPRGTYIHYGFDGHPAAQTGPRIIGRDPINSPATEDEVNNQVTGSTNCPREPDPRKFRIEEIPGGIDAWRNRVTLDNCGQRVPTVKCNWRGCEVENICILLDPIKVAQCTLRLTVPAATMDGDVNAVVTDSIRNSVAANLALSSMGLNYMLRCLREYTRVDANMNVVYVACQRCPVGLPR